MNPRPAGDGFGLHLVTDERVPFARLLEVVDAAASAGVDVVQVRAKSASGREFLRQARAVADAVAGRALVLVNDRVDVALAARDAGARIDGVHLGQSDLPPTTARRLLGAHTVVGWTANTPAHLDAASAFPAGTLDYLGVGVIRPTSTKPNHPPVLGVEGFAGLAARTALPCIAIGGVVDGDVVALRDAGAAGVAVVSAICAADDPGAATRAFRTAAAFATPGAVAAR
ncbi:thiamine phosphate synthase [Microbacterium allomyrinae]|jgi:thiamine-phosphate pyrophosphorylase|uniref:Thiamine-phosphate synthase n=1 Tax=Microbacterium allomyrinae TaxID=2830666 RepID=A0A9X1LSJ5_9MICO|nr:thiamine phosphate synthase [Microbacterium allomyrinae]MCC2031037.1 thiamine phosphate synthase [Microbacterium allomyrinae]